jgi:hypothetical protein
MAHWFGDAKRGRIGSFFNNDPTLLSYWQLDGSAQDNSGNGLDGTASGAVVVPSPFGRGYFFTATTDKITTASRPLSAVPYTIMFWTVIKSGTPGAGRYFCDFGVNQFMVQTNTTGGVSAFIVDPLGAAARSAFQWHDTDTLASPVFVVYTAQTSQQQLFINGKLDTVVAATPGAGTLGTFALGNTAGGSAPINATLYEFAIFNRVLPANVIAQYYEWAIKRHKTARQRFAVRISTAFSKAMSDAIMNAAGTPRLATIARLAAFARKPSDSIMNGAARLATLTKGLARSISDSIMNPKGRLATLAKGFGKSLSDSIMNGSGRSATLSRIVSFNRAMSDTFSYAASRLATLAKGTIVMMSDSIMNAKGRLTTMKAFVNGLLIQFNNKFVKQNTSYSDKLTHQGTTFSDKYQKQNTDFENKFQ